ncbi:hypothetical protein [Streptomyces sp. NBC_00038]|uniref:hypothetical protein n=1 Tax=Streptomyces sp. NBC_00038 TaxID=2903615 RepID=UPI0022593434|nr:hypothetical protein [Streptomyces sp. NBC_00038]MCX5563045.1 hypothetical protein [Streptomyces sp. NBC_00038]
MKPSRLMLLTAVALLVPLAPALSATGAAATTSGTTPAAPQLALINPGFEDGTTGWTFTSGAGVGEGNRHGGVRFLYLDSGAGKSGKQTLVAPRNGSYDFSAWIGSAGTGGTYTIRVNGNVVETVNLPQRAGYARYTISAVKLRTGDVLEISFGSGTSWVNVDDLMISPAASADPKVTSSDPKIVEMFAWAKKKANSWAQLPGTTGPINVDEYQVEGTGSAIYGPSYWAGYANRSAYYSRDMTHQLAGAHILGMDAENEAMLRSYAASATAEHKYFPVWALNFDSKTYLSIDYKTPDNYVREVPAVFELVEKAGQAYRWTGDQSYVNDQVLWDFYQTSTDEFIDLHNAAKPNGNVKVAEGTGNGIFAGAASYNEQDGDGLAEAGDGIASQYQAYLALATLARGKGDTKLAKTYDKRAADLKAYYNKEWSGTGSGADMVRAYTTSGEPVTGWGKENSVFVPMKQILDPGPRNDTYLDYIQAQELGPEGSPNIESTTYLPDMFFKNNRNDTAWEWMKKIYDQREIQHINSSQGPNGDYPEVSFSLVSQTVEGLMGIAPDAANHKVTTQSKLPTGMKWLQSADVPIGTGTITVRHDGATKSTLTNNARSGAYRWEARFQGVHKKITVNGVPQRVRTKTVDGVTYTYATPTVRAGAAAVVKVAD